MGALKTEAMLSLRLQKKKYEIRFWSSERNVLSLIQVTLILANCRFPQTYEPYRCMMPETSREWL